MKNYKIWYLRGRASFEIAFHVPLTGSRVYNTRCHIRYTGTAECMNRKQLVQHKASVGGFHRFWHMEIWHIYILWKRDLLIWKCYKCRHSVILGIYIRLKIVIYQNCTSPYSLTILPLLQRKAMKTNISTVLPVEAWTSSLPTLSKDKVPLNFYSWFGSVWPSPNLTRITTSLS